MKKTGLNRFVRLTCLILAAAFLLFPTGAATAADKHKGPPFYHVTVSVDDKKLCVGESTTVTVKYDLTVGQEKEEPIVRVEFSDGTPPYPTWGGMGHGVVSIDFAATQPGKVTIWGFVNKKPRTGKLVLILRPSK